MSAGDITIDGHDLSPIFGFDGQRYALCSCDERFDGLTIAEVTDHHRQHLDRLEEVLLRPVIRDITRRGVGRAREALAETVARKGAAS